MIPKRAYQMIDVNVYQENTFHTKMALKELALDNYLFGSGVDDFNDAEQQHIRRRLEKEMSEIFYSKNINQS